MKLISKVTVTFYDMRTYKGWLIDRELNTPEVHQVVVIESPDNFNWWEFDAGDPKLEKILQITNIHPKSKMQGWFVTLNVEEFFKEGYEELGFSMKPIKITRKRGVIRKKQHGSKNH